jgi:CDP-6-deoxy-D-xylo-4-hexulose-3-dehydrase
MKGSDEIMNQALFLGTYPGLTKEMMNYEIDTIQAFASCSRKNKF